MSSSVGSGGIYQDGDQVFLSPKQELSYIYAEHSSQKMYRESEIKEAEKDKEARPNAHLAENPSAYFVHSP